MSLSLSAGMIGATSTPTGTPASASARIALIRRCGALARGSSFAARRLSSEFTETSTCTSPSRAIGASRSRSRSTSAFLVTRVQVKVALDQRVLGHEGARVVAFSQKLQRGTGEAPLFLHRLVRVSIAADVDRADLVVRLGQLRAQHLGEIALGTDLRFEVEARRQVEVAVRGA